MGTGVAIGTSVATINQVAKQVQDFIAAATGHPGESIGTILGNMANRRRHNVESVVGKAHFILLNLGKMPREVPLNVLHPLLEGASLQEDDYLRDTWANLLANSADPDNCHGVS